MLLQVVVTHLMMLHVAITLCADTEDRHYTKGDVSSDIHYIPNCYSFVGYCCTGAGKLWVLFHIRIVES